MNDVLVDLAYNDFDAAFVYYPTVDSVGHWHGPDSVEVANEVKAVDLILNNFLDSLENLGLDKKTNVVVVTDHGMSSNVGNVTSGFCDWFKNLVVIGFFL